MSAQPTPPSALDAYFDAWCHKPEVRAAYCGIRHSLDALLMASRQPGCHECASWSRGLETNALQWLKAIAEPDA